MRRPHGPSLARQTWRAGNPGRWPRLAGLRFLGYLGTNKSVRQVQASSGLLSDLSARYDPENLLLFQAHREVLERGRGFR